MTDTKASPGVDNILDLNTTNLTGDCYLYSTNDVMKKKNRKWIYLAVLMGLLVKFIITGIIVILTRGNREDRPDKLSDPSNKKENSITVQTKVSVNLYPEISFA